ncbi:MAG TPA: hypothetical protein EYQ25_03070 [Planctomycetes bacterium]|nr:hypothetical protein [Planctomycetota bacterium]HIL36878.1 hypothetical protein [Planctomycetota bacterium]
MRLSTLTLIASVPLLCSVVVLAHGHQDPLQGEAPGVRHGLEPESVLHAYMGTLADGMDLIEDGLFPQKEEDANDDWDAHLASVIQLQIGALKAKAELPKTLQAKSAGKQETGSLVYTKLMHELVVQLFRMEVALMEHDRKAWEEALIDLEKARTRGHKQFKPRRQGGRRGGGRQGGGDKR